MIKGFILFVAFSITVPAFAQNLARFSDVKPAMTNRSVEKQAIWLANKKGLSYNWPEVYKKAKIISNKWELEPGKNGTTRGRRIHLELYAELPNGKCAMTDFTFRQKLLIDDTYSTELYYVSVGDMVDVDCE